MYSILTLSFSPAKVKQLSLLYELKTTETNRIGIRGPGSPKSDRRYGEHTAENTQILSPDDVARHMLRL